jgi:hypothetical protein
MAVARWRQMRIWGIEKAAMEHEMRRQAGLSNSTSTDSILTEDSATRASLAFRTLSDESRSIDLINRYDSRYERQYYRAHRRFLEVRDRRTPPSAQTHNPAPVDPPPQSVPAPDFSKGTREVVENKPTIPAPNPFSSVFIRARMFLTCIRKAPQAQVRCAADTNQAAQAQARCARSNRQTVIRRVTELAYEVRLFPAAPRLQAGGSKSLRASAC